MSDENNSNNSVAIVAIIVIGLLVAGAGFLFWNPNDNPVVIEKRTVIEEQPAPKDDPDFSFEYQEKDGDGVKMEGDNK